MECAVLGTKEGVGVMTFVIEPVEVRVSPKKEVPPQMMSLLDAIQVAIDTPYNKGHMCFITFWTSGGKQHHVSRGVLRQMGIIKKSDVGGEHYEWNM